MTTTDPAVERRVLALAHYILRTEARVEYPRPEHGPPLARIVSEQGRTLRLVSARAAKEAEAVLAAFEGEGIEEEPSWEERCAALFDALDAAPL